MGRNPTAYARGSRQERPLAAEAHPPGQQVWQRHPLYACLKLKVQNKRHLDERLQGFCTNKNTHTYANLLLTITTRYKHYVPYLLKRMLQNAELSGNGDTY